LARTPKTLHPGSLTSFLDLVKVTRIDY
jgi:hypothetical protein